MLELRAPCQGELDFRMQVAATGTELWCGVRVEVEGVFLRRLCCFAMLIWGEKKDLKSTDAAALFLPVHLFCCPPAPLMAPSHCSPWGPSSFGTCSGLVVVL